MKDEKIDKINLDTTGDSEYVFEKSFVEKGSIILDTLFDMPEEHQRFQADPPLESRGEKLSRMARRADPATSWESAEAVLPNLSETLNRVVELLGGYPGGLTSSEVAGLLDMDKGSSSKRLGDLESLGFVVVDGVRLSDRGRKSSVYKLK